MTPTMDAHGWDRAYSERKRAGSTEPRPVVVEMASTQRPGRALDLGAGLGRNAVWLARQGWAVTAVDFSAVALAEAARRAKQAGVELQCVVADVCTFAAAPESFDLVLISYVHPEPADRDALLAGAAAAVAPAGHLLVLGLGPAADEADGTGSGAQRSGGPDPDRRYTPERITGSVPGVELVRCEQITYEVETDDGPRTAVDVVAWGQRPPARRAE